VFENKKESNKKAKKYNSEKLYSCLGSWQPLFQGRSIASPYQICELRNKNNEYMDNNVFLFSHFISTISASIRPTELFR